VDLTICQGSCSLIMSPYEASCFDFVDADCFNDWPPLWIEDLVPEAFCLVDEQLHLK